MKKKLLVTLLSLTLIAGLVCGCGKEADQDAAIQTAPAEISTESPDETEPTAEPQATAEPEETAEATPAPEPTQAPASDEQEKTEGNTSDSQTDITETPAPAETPAETPAADDSNAEAPAEPAADYTITEMSATMYVKNSVNLRQGPGTEYAKVGTLAKGQQVTVTGQAGNGWFQLDSGAFVSNKYLGDTAPAQQVAGATSADPTVPVDTVGVGTTTTVSTSSGVDFVNYLNQQRSAAGLGTLTWDDGMATVAQRRATEISKDLSHNGNVEQYGEIIQLAVTGSASDWYTNWYNSEAHRTSMLAANYTRAGCAVYAIGNNYYVVCNFAGTPLTTDQLIEQAQPDNLVPAGGNENGTTSSFSTTGETLKPGDPNYDFINNIFEQYIEEDNQ